MTRGLNGRHSLKGIGLAPLGKTEEPLFPGALLNILAERVSEFSAFPSFRAPS
jgi:hypothetical protein